MFISTYRLFLITTQVTKLFAFYIVFTSLSPEYSGFTFDFFYFFVYIKVGEVNPAKRDRRATIVGYIIKCKLFNALRNNLIYSFFSHHSLSNLDG